MVDSLHRIGRNRDRAFLLNFLDLEEEVVNYAEMEYCEGYRVRWYKNIRRGGAMLV
jgi:hypothetical protein